MAHKRIWMHAALESRKFRGVTNSLSYNVIIGIPYSGKFSMVQNFTELLANTLEEIFVV
jgi:hypothetical protein